MRISGATVGMYLLAVAVFGVLLPWMKGIDFLDASLFLTYASLSAVLAAPIVTDFTARQKRVVPAVLARAVLFGWLTALLILSIGVVTVNESHRYPGWLLPTNALMTASIVWSLCGALLFASLGSWLGMRARSPQAARTSLRMVLLVLLAGALAYARVVPEEWKARVPTWTDRFLARATWIGLPITLVLSAAFYHLAASSRYPTNSHEDHR